MVFDRNNIRYLIKKQSLTSNHSTATKVQQLYDVFNPIVKLLCLICAYPIMIGFSGDLQVFQLPGVGLMAAMAHRSSVSGSAVYLWTQSGFQLYQNISTYGALAWRHFRISKKVKQMIDGRLFIPQQKRYLNPECSLCFCRFVGVSCGV